MHFLWHKAFDTEHRDKALQQSYFHQDLLNLVLWGRVTVKPGLRVFFPILNLIGREHSFALTIIVL